MANWKEITGYPDYLVSDEGQVMRTKRASGTQAGRILKPLNCDGYPTVCLYYNGRRKLLKVHILVALTFIGPRPSTEHEVAHNDGNRSNSHHTNLRWATYEENRADMLKHGTKRKGDQCSWAKLTEADVAEIKHRLVAGASKHDLAAEFGVHSTTIQKIQTVENWRHVCEHLNVSLLYPGR